MGVKIVMKITMTRELARAASWDAANRNMKKHGRKKWNQEDYNTAVTEYDRLWPIENDMKGGVQNDA